MDDCYEGGGGREAERVLNVYSLLMTNGVWTQDYWHILKVF